jgi:hypothetical protein
MNLGFFNERVGAQSTTSTTIKGIWIGRRANGKGKAKG